MKEKFSALPGQPPTPPQFHPTPVEELLTDKQTAEIFSVKPRTLRLWRESLGLPFIRITSKVIRYRRSDLHAWAAKKRTAIAA
jgi:Helix-turn-helix domain